MYAKSQERVCMQKIKREYVCTSQERVCMQKVKGVCMHKVKREGNEKQIKNNEREKERDRKR